ncbi:hypothetical protein D9M70_509790 [compost metagenome]
MEGGRFAERDGIQPARQERGNRERSEDDRRCSQDLSPVGAGERTEAPEGQVAQLLIVGPEDENAGDRTGQRAERNAGEQ